MYVPLVRTLSSLNPVLATYKMLLQCSSKTLIVCLPQLCDFELCTVRGMCYISADSRAAIAYITIGALEMRLRNGILLLINEIYMTTALGSADLC